MGATAGVDKHTVAKMLDVLRAANERVVALEVNKPGAGELGGSPSGQELLALMEAATERIKSTLSNLSKTINDFGDAIRAAERAVNGADEDAGTYADKMAAGLELMDRPFFENLGKDKRVQVGDIPLLPGIGDLLTRLGADNQFDQGGK